MSAPQMNYKQIIKAFYDNYYVITRQTHTITHNESMLEPPFRGNTMNWVVGHIILGRDEALHLLDAKPVMPHPLNIQTYETGSNPDNVTNKHLPFNRLLEMLKDSQKRLEHALEKIPNASFASKIMTQQGERTLQEALNDLHWHETYHVGQLELLRQLAGRNDSVL